MKRHLSAWGRFDGHAPWGVKVNSVNVMTRLEKHHGMGVMFFCFFFVIYWGVFCNVRLSLEGGGLYSRGLNG